MNALVFVVVMVLALFGMFCATVALVMSLTGTEVWP
jgi:hypothetical protein